MSVDDSSNPHHFDGKRFRNPEMAEMRGFGDLLRWWRNRQPGPWRAWTDSPPGPPPPRRGGDGRLRVSFVNHSTFLIQVDGTNILTDPIWSMRASPFQWIGPRRHRAPGLRFEDLPPVDLILLSHNHYDHLDVCSILRLPAEWSPSLIVPLGNRRFLEKRGVRSVREVDWWDLQNVTNGLEVTSRPSRHFSVRGLRDRNKTLWCGYVIKGPSGIVYFAGDTGFGGHFDQIGRLFGEIRLALLPIGAFRPRWFMSPVHMSPDEAVRAHRV